ncbi:POTRA domain-containing protein [Agriterribacter sp.]|uniref:POTRA domain-containing protein n=1 Tax=Agriterribacter sp. TaxID=2821509 RepID=UPI002C618011|nr:POTRA domain-containing protein [Agriterribacter sp.]HRO45630.1 ShlB/FhaC/HecB family hemolysin secretion/activation protein [Agriterribacter sp.]
MLLVLLVMNRLRCFTGLVFLVLLSLYAGAQDKYRLHYVFAGKDTSFRPETLGLQTTFANQAQCRQYIDQAISSLQLKGYITASADSTVFDSTAAQVWIYAGNVYQWAELNTDSADKKMLAAIGWNSKAFTHTPLDFAQVRYWQERMLNYYENNGYPFAQVVFDSLTIANDSVFSSLKTAEGPAYKIDSIRVYGNAKISNTFLQKYLGIANGSAYSKARLQAVSRRLLELPYLKEIKTWDMTMTGSGSVLNLYIDSRKSSQVDVLVGFLPAAEGTGRTKLQLTGEANINLKNALGSGETIGVNWQQIQVKSPRLHLKYEHPFVFNSPFGFDFNFDLLKKDSSFLNLNAQFGVQYLSTGKQTGKVFFQSFFTNVLPAGIDTAQIKISKRLPSYIDVNTSNVGIHYGYNNTDYRFNPRRGNEFTIITSAGLRKIKPNAAIAGIKKDASGNDFDYASLYDTLDLRTYLLKLNLAGAHYFKTGKQSVLKAAVNGAWLYTHDIFKNEMYQIGGYKLLRGFDEESIYASSYAVLTAEYRVFIGLNSYFFGFADGGWIQNKAYGEVQEKNHTYLGLGIGMAFETKAGIFNLSYAVGKRDDMPINFRQSKIHFGLVSLF